MHFSLREQNEQATKQIQQKKKKKSQDYSLAAFVSVFARPSFHWMIKTKFEEYYPAEITIPVLQVVTHRHTTHIYSPEQKIFFPAEVSTTCGFLN